MFTKEQMDAGSDYRDFYKLPPERQKKLLDWVNANLKKAPKINPRHTSYNIKSFVNLGPGENSYFTNGEMKGAMIEAGFEAGDLADRNWTFNVTEDSLPWYDPNRYSV